MAEESTIQGLNVVQDSPQENNDMLDSPLHPDLEAQLQMWTNLEFPTDDSPFFNPERDTASRSRHKAINGDGHFGAKIDGLKRGYTPDVDPIAAGLGFFGSVGAAAVAGSSNNAAVNAARAHNLNDMFGWSLFPTNQISTSTTEVFPNIPEVSSDPFSSVGGLSFGQTAVVAAQDAHHPLTIRDAQVMRAKQLAALTQSLTGTVDPSNTSLGITPPAAKRPRRKGTDDEYSPAEERSSGHSRNLSLPPTSNTNTANKASSSMIDDDEHDDHNDDMPPSKRGGPYNAAEDKRRRNTLASARFRAKKKEREAAMEKKAKELDDRVQELERECDSLRKENGWLKGLVVGATNGEPLFPGSNPPSTSASRLQSALPSAINSVINSVVTSPAIPIGPNPPGGNVIDIEHLIRVLRENGAVITTGSAMQAQAQAQEQAIQEQQQQQQQQQQQGQGEETPVAKGKATGKRKRGAAN